MHVFRTPVKDGLKKESVLGRKITSQRFEDQTLFRFEEYERKRKDRLLVQKKEMMKCELDKYTLTPRINKKNGNERSRNPLVSRLDDILQDRKIKIDNKRSKFVSKAEEELKECTFTPKIKSNVPTRSVDDLFKWQKEKKLRLMEKSIENENREDKCKFTPELSKHSRALLKKKTNQKEFQKVEDRLMSYLKIKGKDQEEENIARQGKSPATKSIRSKSKTRGVRPLQLKPEDNVMCFTLQETDEVEKEGFTMAVQRIEVGCDRELCFSFKKDRQVSGGFKAFQTDSVQSCQSKQELKKESAQLSDSPTKAERFNKPVAKCRESRDVKQEVVLSAAELNGIIQTNKLNKKKNNVDKMEQKENINQENVRASRTEKCVQERTPLKDRANEAKVGGKGLKTSIVDKINKAKVGLKDSKPEPKKGVSSALDNRLETRAVTKALDKDASKLKKTEIIEKYGVKVKKQEIDTQEIQESFVGGGTSSMLNNLKRINQHLKKFNDCPSIIKEGKGASHPIPPVSPIKVPLDSAIVQSNVYLQKFQEVADGGTRVEAARIDKNPFLTLFDKNQGKV